MSTDEIVFFFYIFGALSGWAIHALYIWGKRLEDEKEKTSFKNYTPYDWEME